MMSQAKFEEQFQYRITIRHSVLRDMIRAYFNFDLPESPKLQFELRPPQEFVAAKREERDLSVSWSTENGRWLEPKP